MPGASRMLAGAATTRSLTQYFVKLSEVANFNKSFAQLRLQLQALINFLKNTKGIKWIVKALNRRAVPLARSRQIRTAALRCVQQVFNVSTF